MVSFLVKLAHSFVPVSNFHRCSPNGAETFVGTAILECYDLAAAAVGLCGKPGTAAKRCNIDLRLEAIDGFLEFRVTVTVARGLGLGRRRWRLHNGRCVRRVDVTLSSLVRHGVTLATTLVPKLD